MLIQTFHRLLSLQEVRIITDAFLPDIEDVTRLSQNQFIHYFLRLQELLAVSFKIPGNISISGQSSSLLAKQLKTICETLAQFYNHFVIS